MSMKQAAQIKTLIEAVDLLAERIDALEAITSKPVENKPKPQKAKKTH